MKPSATLNREENVKEVEPLSTLYRTDAEDDAVQLESTELSTNALMYVLAVRYGTNYLKGPARGRIAAAMRGKEMGVSSVRVCCGAYLQRNTARGNGLNRCNCREVGQALSQRYNHYVDIVVISSFSRWPL